jgi:hypothetical protein
VVEDNGEILQRVAGRIILEDGRLTYELSSPPKHALMFERILAEKMIIEGGWREVDPRKEPAVWFHALPLNIRGTYLWARMVTYPHSSNP